MLSSCSIFQLKTNYPTPPQALMVKAKALPKIERDEAGEAKEVDLIKYTHQVIQQYNLIKLQTNSLINWVNEIGKTND